MPATVPHSPVSPHALKKPCTSSEKRGGVMARTPPPQRSPPHEFPDPISPPAHPCVLLDHLFLAEIDENVQAVAQYSGSSTSNDADGGKGVAEVLLSRRCTGTAAVTAKSSVRPHRPLRKSHSVGELREGRRSPCERASGAARRRERHRRPSSFPNTSRRGTNTSNTSEAEVGATQADAAALNSTNAASTPCGDRSGYAGKGKLVGVGAACGGKASALPVEGESVLASGLAAVLPRAAAEGHAEVGACLSTASVRAPAGDVEKTMTGSVSRASCSSASSWRCLAAIEVDAPRPVGTAAPASPTPPSSSPSPAARSAEAAVAPQTRDIGAAATALRASVTSFVAQLLPRPAPPRRRTPSPDGAAAELPPVLHEVPDSAQELSCQAASCEVGADGAHSGAESADADAAAAKSASATAEGEEDTTARVPSLGAVGGGGGGVAPSTGSRLRASSAGRGPQVLPTLSWRACACACERAGSAASTDVPGGASPFPWGNWRVVPRGLVTPASAQAPLHVPLPRTSADVFQSQTLHPDSASRDGPGTSSVVASVPDAGGATPLLPPPSASAAVAVAGATPVKRSCPLPFTPPLPHTPSRTTSRSACTLSPVSTEAATAHVLSSPHTGASPDSSSGCISTVAAATGTAPPAPPPLLPPPPRWMSPRAASAVSHEGDDEGEDAVEAAAMLSVATPPQVAARRALAGPVRVPRVAPLWVEAMKDGVARRFARLERAVEQRGPDRVWSPRTFLQLDSPGCASPQHFTDTSRERVEHAAGPHLRRHRHPNSSGTGREAAADFSAGGDTSTGTLEEAESEGHRCLNCVVLANSSLSPTSSSFSSLPLSTSPFPLSTSAAVLGCAREEDAFAAAATWASTQMLHLSDA